MHLCLKNTRPESYFIDPELSLCRAAILVYADRLNLDAFANTRLERSRSALLFETRNYDQRLTDYLTLPAPTAG
jgi:hypothetical protein